MAYSTLREAFDDGRAHYPLIISVNSSYRTNVFTAAQIWNGKFLVDRYCAGNNGVEIGTAVTAECNFSLRYVQSFINWLAGKEQHLFVGCKEFWDYDTAGVTVVAAMSGDTSYYLDYLVNSLNLGETKKFLYVGDSGTLTTTEFSPNVSVDIKYGQLVTVTSNAGGSLTVVTEDVLCPMGMFYVDDGISLTRNSIDVVGYDILGKCDVDFDGTRENMGISESQVGVTAKEYIDYVAAKVGADVSYDDEIGNAANSYYNNTLYPAIPEKGSCTCRNILQYVGQLTGSIFTVFPDSPRTISLVRYDTSPDPVVALNYDNTYLSKVNSNSDKTVGGLLISNASTELAANNLSASTKGIYLRIVGNKIISAAKKITATKLQNMVNSAWYRIGSGDHRLVYRPFEVKSVPFPYLKLYDMVTVVDNTGADVKTGITHINYRLNSQMTLKCSGDARTTVSRSYSNTSQASNESAAAAEKLTRASKLYGDSVWSSGSKTIANISDYNLYLMTVKDSSDRYYSVICRKDYGLTGMNYSSISGDARVRDDGTLTNLYVKITFTSGDACSISYATRGVGSAYDSLSIVNIYGII